jgi:hypothetical protein
MCDKCTDIMRGPGVLARLAAIIESAKQADTNRREVRDAK